MNDNMYRVRQPVGFQLLPQQNLLEGMPADTDVLHFGHAHNNLFHLMTINDILPDLVKMGFGTIAWESSQSNQQHVMQALSELSGDPVEIDRDRLPRSRAYNHFSNIICGFGYYQIMRHARDLGMNIKCIDDPDIKKMEDPKSPAMMKRRNKSMAKATPEKAICLDGYHHLYNAVPDKRASSLQALQQQRGLKTYSIGMTSLQYDVIIKQYTERLATNDKKAFQAIMTDYRQEHKQLTQRTDIVSYDLHKFSRRAGCTIPDKMVLFPHAADEWMLEMKLMGQFSSCPEAQAEMWNSIRDVGQGATTERYIRRQF